MASNSMKLFYAATSPFARKVRVLIAEKDITGVELVTVSPFETPSELIAVNPLSKVPALLLEDGGLLYDSPVICEYLDGLDGIRQFIPPLGKARWSVLRLQALSDGLMETVLSLALEINRRPENERSPQWIDRWCATIRRAVDSLELEVKDFDDALNLGQIAAGCALSYVDLRAAAFVSWREGCPELAAWHAGFELRPSMQSTQPE